MHKKKLLITIIVVLVAFLFSFLFIFTSRPLSNTDNLSNKNLSIKYKTSEQGDEDFSENEEEDKNQSTSRSKAKQIRIGEGLSFKPNTTHLIIFDFKILVEPENEKRRQLISKYDSSLTPPKGWAVAIKKTAASTKMEFYINDGNNALGWLTFSSIDLEINKDSTFVFIIKPGDFISLHKIYPENPKKVEDLGVYSLDKLEEISSLSDLQISSGKVSYNKFRSQIDNIKILEFKETVFSKKDLIKILQKGTNNLLNNKSMECLIAIPNSGLSCRFGENS